MHAHKIAVTLPRGSWQRVEGILAELDKAERPRMTKEEIDALVAEERASWGDGDADRGAAQDQACTADSLGGKSGGT